MLGWCGHVLRARDNVVERLASHNRGRARLGVARDGKRRRHLATTLGRRKTETV